MNNKEYLFKEYGHALDAEVLTRYTNALYVPGPTPTFDEFRDMFSTGQVLSKLWALSELDNQGLSLSVDSVLIAGAWYGTLGVMLNKLWPEFRINLLDIDANCMLILNNIVHDLANITPITHDMHCYNYVEDLIINTSCEHIPDLNEWLSLIPKDKFVLLQSNNCIDIHGHINCVNSVEQFKNQANLSEVLYADEFDLGMYTRYMIIGLT